MKPGDSEPSPSIPTLTWDSVVDEPAPSGDDVSNPEDTPSQSDVMPDDDAVAGERISFDLQLDLGGGATPASASAAGTTSSETETETETETAPDPAPTDPPADQPAPALVMPALTLDRSDAASAGPAAAESQPPNAASSDHQAVGDIGSPAPAAASVEAAIAPVTATAAEPATATSIEEQPSSEHSLQTDTSDDASAREATDVAAPAPSTPPPPLPPIREATPVEPLPVTPAAPPAPSSDAVPVLAPQVATAAAPAPIQLPPSHQPDQTTMGRAIPSAATAASMVAAPPRRRKRRGRGLLALLFTLLVLGGIVAAAVIVGRPLLFPESDWDVDVEAYAVAIEEARGIEFVEPVEVVAEPATVFERRVNAEQLGDWEQQLPLWRALGLANGAVTVAAVDELLTGGPTAAYASSDGRVYQVEGSSGVQSDASVTGALTAAALDQEVRWSAEQDTRTLDGQTLVDAAVLAEQDRVRALTAFDTPLARRDPARLAFLPPVLGYRTIAPPVYAALLPTDAAMDAAAVERYAAIGDIVVAPSNPPVLPPGVSADGAAIAPDQSFWYLVFAGYVDAPTAYAASEAIVESSLTTATTDGVMCAYATFSGGAVAATTSLRSALDTWAASAPAEFTAAVTVLDDGTLQLRSCDPGAGFENGARFGTASELAGFRAAELATLSGVVDGGGSDADVAAALGRLDTAGVGAQLAALSPDTSAADLAAAAEASVEAVVVTPPAAAPAPATEE